MEKINYIPARPNTPCFLERAYINKKIIALFILKLQMAFEYSGSLFGNRKKIFAELFVLLVKNLSS